MKVMYVSGRGHVRTRLLVSDRRGRIRAGSLFQPRTVDVRAISARS
jgi:hypothetical protein